MFPTEKKWTELTVLSIVTFFQSDIINIMFSFSPAIKDVLVTKSSIQKEKGLVDLYI